MSNVVIEFLHKVRGGFSPNELQKVFISFHSSDRIQMEQVASDILEVMDCAVYYHETLASVKKQDINMDDYELKLMEMKLFVVVITTNYLVSDSLSKNTEIGFALSHNIPILPIAVETDLEELYMNEMNKIEDGLGTLQLLNRFVFDRSALPYMQKLTVALNSVLVDREQVHRIKAAFNKRIFLSYRKKDRKYANELIRTIHSIPALERTAIWYDEFLSSGEKWDEQIREAISHSDVFLLLVTPFITEPDNYVIREEYPTAQSMNKEIFSVKKTDSNSIEFRIEELKKTFPGLEILIDGNNVAELENALLKFGTNSKSTLEQDYLIGLAYFNGIDVERDNDKAVSLIVASAEGGLPDAVSKLADMYWMGDGVAVNYENSIQWKKKLIAIYQQRFSFSQKQGDVLMYIKSMDDLAICLFELSAFREALEYEKRVISILEQNSSEFSVASFFLAKAYGLCGKCCQKLGALHDAADFCEKDCEQSQKIYAADRTTENLHNIAVAFERTGDVYYEMGDLNSAEKWYEKSLEIMSLIHDKLGSRESAYSLSALCLDIGAVYMKNHRYIEAKELYTKGIELRKSILKAKNSDENKRTYVETLVALGETFMYTGDIPNAERLFSESEHIIAELATKQGIIEVQYAYSLVLNRLAMIQEIKKNFQDALEYYTKSLGIRKRILSKLRTLNTVYEYATSLFYVAHTQATLYHSSEAKQRYDELIDMMLPLLPKAQKKDWYDLVTMASFNRFRMDTFAGERYLQYTIESMKWLSNHYLDNAEYQKKYVQYREMYKRCYPQSK